MDTKVSDMFHLAEKEIYFINDALNSAELSNRNLCGKMGSSLEIIRKTLETFKDELLKMNKDQGSAANVETEYSDISTSVPTIKVIKSIGFVSPVKPKEIKDSEQTLKIVGAFTIPAASFERGDMILGVKNIIPEQMETSEVTEHVNCEDNGTSEADTNNDTQNSGKSPYVCSVYSYEEMATGKPYRCKKCHKGYYTISAVAKHMLSHEIDKSFSCSKCPRTFISKFKLDKHEFTHNVYEKFTCNICNQSFAKYVFLRTHVEKHKCSICKMTLKDVSERQVHLRTHKDHTVKVNTQKDVCSVCLRTYSNKKRFADHMQLHVEGKV